MRRALKFWAATPDIVPGSVRSDGARYEVETNKMLCSPSSQYGGARLASPLLVNDLCAQLAPLNRYGLIGLSAAIVSTLRGIVSALRALTEASRMAAQAAAGCARA